MRLKEILFLLLLVLSQTWDRAICWPCLAFKAIRILCLEFIIEYSSLRDFYRPLGNNNNNNNRSIFIERSLKDAILACVETWD